MKKAVFSESNSDQFKFGIASVVMGLVAGAVIMFIVGLAIDRKNDHAGLEANCVKANSKFTTENSEAWMTESGPTWSGTSKKALIDVYENYQLHCRQHVKTYASTVNQ